MELLKKLLNAVTDDVELGKPTTRLLSLLFLTAASVLSMMEYTREVTGGSWASWATRTLVADSMIPTPIHPGVLVHNIEMLKRWLWPGTSPQTPPQKAKIHKVTFHPGFLEAVAAIALITPLYLRGLLKWKASVYSIVSFVLILLVFASFVSIALGGNESGNVYVKGALVAAVILSWLGMRGIAGASWILAIGAAVYSLHVNNIDLGFLGFAFIASASLGLILHSGLNPGEFFHGLAAEYAPAARLFMESSRGDIRAFGDGVRDAAHVVIDRTLPGK